MSHVLENHVVGCGLFFAVSEHHREPRVTDAGGDGDRWVA
jgi:hypothetical protein